MAAAKSRINFYDLPPEIHNTIYEMAFAHHYDSYAEGDSMVVQDIDWVIDKDYEAFRPDHAVETDQAPRGERLSPPILLQVSQQIRDEAQAFYYGSTTFLAQLFRYDTTFVAAWLQHLGPTRCALIKNLILEIYLKHEEDVIDDIEDMRTDAESNVLHPNFLPKEEEAEGAAVTQLRTTVSYVAQFLDLAKYGVPASSFKVHLEQDCEDVSDTALWCVECGESHEPDGEQFQGGVCTWCYDVDEGRRRGRRERELWIVEHADRSNVDNGSGVRRILDRVAGKN